MKYFDYAYKIILVILLSVILCYSIRLVSFVDEIGSIIYRSAKPVEMPVSIANLSLGDIFTGSDSAKTKMTIYIDLQCSFCKQFFNTVIPQIEEKYVEKGYVAIILSKMH
jgi:protein-disulfide isomerase